MLEYGFLSHVSLNCLFPCKLFCKEYSVKRASVVTQKVKNIPPMQDTWVKSMDREGPVRREWPPTPVFLPEESRGQRSLAGYSTRGHRELDTAEKPSTCARTHTHTHTHTHILLRLWICQPVKKWKQHDRSITQTEECHQEYGAFLPAWQAWGPCSGLSVHLPSFSSTSLPPLVRWTHQPRKAHTTARWLSTLRPTWLPLPASNKHLPHNNRAILHTALRLLPLGQAMPSNKTVLSLKFHCKLLS